MATPSLRLFDEVFMQFLYSDRPQGDDDRPLWQVNATVAHLHEAISLARPAARDWSHRPLAARLRSLRGAGHFLLSRRDDVLSWSQWDQQFCADAQAFERLTHAIDALTHPQMHALHCPELADSEIHPGMVGRLALPDRAASLDLLMKWAIPVMAAGHGVVVVLTYAQLCRLPLQVLAVGAVLRGWLPPGVFELLCTNDPTVTHRLARDPRLSTLALAANLPSVRPAALKPTVTH